MCERYVRESTTLSQILPANWKLDRQQQWWYYVNYTQAAEDKNPEKLAVFLAECPASANAAFQSRQRSIVPITVIQDVESKLP